MFATKKDQPWYKTIKDRSHNNAAVDSGTSEKAKEVDLKRKLLMDPLTTINKVMSLSENAKKKKLDNHHKKSKYKEKRESPIEPKKTKTIEQLRAER